MRGCAEAVCDGLLTPAPSALRAPPPNTLAGYFGEDNKERNMYGRFDDDG